MAAKKKAGRPAKSEAKASGASKSGAPKKTAKTAGDDLASAHDKLEATLWAAADKLRNNMDAAEYKHVVLGLIFLKYISDAFLERYKALEAEKSQGADPEDKDEYRGEGIFWVPKEARWPSLQAKAKQATIGKAIDDAMVAIERDNPSLKGALPKVYAKPDLDKQRLGELVDIFSNLGLGTSENKSKDLLGRVYEYFLSQFASAEWCSCSCRCWRRTRAACSIRAAAQAACSCRARSSSRRTAASSGTSRSTARSRTPPRGGSPR
jgi:type I restriction enzyme M protein